ERGFVRRFDCTRSGVECCHAEAPISRCHSPRKQGIQYSAAPVVTGFPAFTRSWPWPTSAPIKCEKSETSDFAGNDTRGIPLQRKSSRFLFGAGAGAADGVGERAGAAADEGEEGVDQRFWCIRQPALGLGEPLAEQAAAEKERAIGFAKAQDL